MLLLRQKTAYELRFSDWSSDVCASDLDAIDRRRLVVSCVLAKPIVLADEYHRQFPDRREIERLMERADIRRAITEIGNGDAPVPGQLRTPGEPVGDRQRGTDDTRRHHDPLGGRGDRKSTRLNSSH